jgi:hypothetical protein
MKFLLHTRNTPLGLRAGDWVVVRPIQEILTTLDSHARLDGLPFQPEMLAFCGQKLQVAKIAHKTCDTIHKTGGRRMRGAVHLRGARCDGASHGGCQADCVFFWKEAWLRRADRDGADPRQLGNGCTEADIHRLARAPDEAPPADPTWVCQTTRLYDATEPLMWWDARQYIRDVTSGNHRAWRIIMLLVAAGYRNLTGLGIGYRALVWFYNTFQKIAGGKPFPDSQGLIPLGAPTPVAELKLRPGEWVEVKSSEEIMRTINKNGFNRGMRHDMEMLKYSGGQYRVEKRVERIINEQTGKMMSMKTACIQLEDVYCRAECTPMRLGCPRAMSTYWREIWLRRVPGPGRT